MLINCYTQVCASAHDLDSHSYNMVGHCKFCVTLIGGVLLFSEPIATNQLLGIACTMSGIAMYTYFKLNEQKSSAEESSGRMSQKV